MDLLPHIARYRNKLVGASGRSKHFPISSLFCLLLWCDHGQIAYLFISKLGVTVSSFQCYREDRETELNKRNVSLLLPTYRTAKNEFSFPV